MRTYTSILLVVAIVSSQCIPRGALAETIILTVLGASDDEVISLLGVILDPVIVILGNVGQFKDVGDRLFLPDTFACTLHMINLKNFVFNLHLKRGRENLRKKNIYG